jgi:hypothetical protein
VHLPLDGNFSTKTKKAQTNTSHWPTAPTITERQNKNINKQSNHAEIKSPTTGNQLGE